MKTINEFANDVLQKSSKFKKKKRIKRIITALSLIPIFIFFILFSNIPPFDKSFTSQTYKKYLAPYINKLGDTGLKILDSDSAILTLNSYAIPCSLKKSGAKTFKITPISEEETDDKLTIKFSEDKAIIDGFIKNKKINEELNPVEELKIINGLWQMFAMQSGDGEIKQGNSNWFYINDKQSYAGEGLQVWYCDFIGIGNKTIALITDQTSGVSQVSLVQKLPDNQFGFPVLQCTIYEYESDDGWHTYYKLTDTTNPKDFCCNLQTDIVTYEYDTDQVNELAFWGYDNINWRISSLGSADIDFMKMQLDMSLNSNGTVNLKISNNSFFKSNSTGIWFNIRDFVLVILDQKIPKLKIKAFTIYNSDKTGEKPFEQNAVSNLTLVDAYKVGFHKFLYFWTDVDINVFWGSSYTWEYFSRKVKLNTEYFLSLIKITYFDEHGNITNVVSEEPSNTTFSQRILIFKDEYFFRWVRYGGHVHYEDLYTQKPDPLGVKLILNECISYTIDNERKTFRNFYINEDGSLYSSISFNKGISEDNSSSFVYKKIEIIVSPLTN